MIASPAVLEVYGDLTTKFFRQRASSCSSPAFSPISYYLSIDLIKWPLYYVCMDMFSALAEPHRRSILEMLASEGQLSASAIARKFRVSPPAISQHLKVLREAGLLRMEKRAQQRLYQVNPEAMH